MAKEETEKKSTSGKVRIEDNIIYWDYENENLLQININEIVVIGEYTNSDGPYFDDWFLTFVSKDGQWQSIPRYAANIDNLTTYLSTKFDQDFNTTNLANSTEWKSSILYPTHLKDKMLFKLKPSSTYKTPKTLLDKILSSVGFGNFDTTQDIGLTEDVKNELANASR